MTRTEKPDVVTKLKARHGEVFGPSDSLVFVRAPGRVNLIGGHTDYNEGYVLPMCIDKYLYAVASLNGSDEFRIYSENFDAESRFSIHEIVVDSENPWSNYERGVVSVLREEEHAVRGCNILIDGDLPIGAGLSSSAAVEVATLMVLVELNHLPLSTSEVIALAQRAENEFVGVPCGIMDQFVCVQGKRGTALLLDTRDLSYRYATITASEVAFVVCDSRKARTLADSAYTERLEECREGVRLLNHHLSSEVKALRDVSLKELERLDDRLPPEIARRCRHVITENERVTEAAESLSEGDLKRFGELLNASHRSLRDDYEVSCAELDCLAEIAWETPGVYGARMTGAGFGGCTITVLTKEAVPHLVERAKRGFLEMFGKEPGISLVRPTEGAALL